MFSTFLESIEEPLASLLRMGLVIFAIETAGTTTLGELDVSEWRTMYYLVVPMESYFRGGDFLSQLKVHRFNPECRVAINDLVQALKGKDEGVMVWGNKHLVETDYEKEVPWRFDCCPDETISTEVEYG